MAMEARLSMRLSQRVVMTPLLQQAIQLLQLSTLELQEVVQKELLENPLLEEVPTENPETPEASAPGETPTPTAPTAEVQPLEPPPVDRERGTDDLPFDLTAVMFDDHEERSLVAQEDRDELPFENMVRSVSSLTDYLDELDRGGSERKNVEIWFTDKANAGWPATLSGLLPLVLLGALWLFMIRQTKSRQVQPQPGGTAVCTDNRWSSK